MNLTLEETLRERIKELTCVYDVLSVTSDSSSSIGDICRRVAAILQRGMLYPADAVARLRVDGLEYGDRPWPTPLHLLAAPLIRDGKAVGSIEVAYEALPGIEPDQDAFLPEESSMVAAAARHASNMLERRAIDEKVAQQARLSAVGELTGGIAHDFNNLLTVILGTAEVLEERLRSDSEQAHMASVIISAAQRGAELTSQLLAFGRRQPLLPRATDVRAMVVGIRPMLAVTLGEQIELVLEFPEDLSTIMVDQAQLESAILNLCVNARHAMPSGGRLIIKGENVLLDAAYPGWNEEVSPGPYVMIDVTDSGCGMAPEVARQAFEPFFTTRDVGEGSGLGLSMVFGFVRQSEGNVQIYSEPGLGTSVKLYFPRIATTRPAADDATAAAPLGSERVIVVEDDPGVLAYAAEMLRSQGYQVATARNGREALDVVRKDDGFDLLFTDIVMPGGLNGPSLAREVRALIPGVKVLYTSGYPDRALALEEDGAIVHFLQKPYRRQALSLKLREVLGAGMA